MRIWLQRGLVVALHAGALSAAWVSVVRGRELQRTAPEVFLGAAPLVGENFRDGWDWRFGWGLVGAGLVALVVAAAARSGWYDRTRLRTVVVSSGVAAGAFALLLALTDGRRGVLRGVVDETEYLANLSTAPPAGDFVRNFVADIDDYSVHVQGHPPGYVLLLKILDAIGLGGPWPVVALSLLSTMVVPVAVLVTAWCIAGEAWVRRAAPFMVVVPYALWLLTSADAFFSALAAGGVALLAVAFRRSGRTALVVGAVGGFVLSTMLFMTYGGALFLFVPAVLAVVWYRNPAWWTPDGGTSGGVVPATVGAVAAALFVTVSWAAAGFWWFAGAAATRVEYWEGTAQFRVWDYFIVSNLVVAVIAVGPAGWFGLTRLRDPRLWTLVGGALLAVVVADLSQLSKGETERIWLLFFPWIALAGAALVRPVAIGSRRLSSTSVQAGWVTLQAAAAIVLQAALVSKW